MLKHSLVLIFTVIACAFARQEDNLFCNDPATCCNGLPDLTSLADWQNCTIYYLCFGGAPSAYSCLNINEQFYDPQTNRCSNFVDGCVDGTRPPNSDSTFPPTTPIYTPPLTDLTIGTTLSPGDGNCTEDGVYFTAYPGDCRKYMICSNGILLPDVQECPSGTLFDPDLRECNLESLVECKPTCPGSDTVTIPHARNCSLYWLCTLGTPTLRECPPGLVYDYILGTCNLESAVFCPNLCPSTGTINLPHSQNCSLYWLCVMGAPTLKQCAPDLLFDALLGQCNLATEVDCSRNEETKILMNFKHKYNARNEFELEDNVDDDDDYYDLDSESRHRLEYGI